MLKHVRLQDILFIDIETAPLQPNFSELDSEMQKLWDYRVHRYRPEEIDLDDYYFEKAGVYAEFGKTICISVGFFSRIEEFGEYQFRIKSFYGHQEVEDVLQPFFELLSLHYNAEKYYLCGHNIRDFDIPFLCRRAVINRLPIPRILDASNLKPWEIKHLDTMLLWRFGDVRNMTSLHLLCTVLGINTPKNDMEGKEVAAVYWQQKNLQRIMQYNQKDVIAVAQILLRLKEMPPLDEERHIICIN